MLRKNLSDLFDNGSVGDWCFLRNDSRIGIMFGDDNFHDCVTIPISTNPTQKEWKWNGDKENPTIQPSILVYPSNVTKGWHGYLTDGKLITL